MMEQPFKAFTPDPSTGMLPFDRESARIRTMAWQFDRVIIANTKWDDPAYIPSDNDRFSFTHDVLAMVASPFPWHLSYSSDDVKWLKVLFPHRRFYCDGVEVVSD